MANRRVEVGDLRHRVEVFEPLPEPDRNRHNEPAAQFRSLGRRWALVEPLTSREVLQGEQVQSDTTHRITLRHVDGLSARHKFLFRGRWLHAAGPPRNPGERGGTTLAEVFAVEREA